MRGKRGQGEGVRGGGSGLKGQRGKRGQGEEVGGVSGKGVRGHRCPLLTRYLGLDARLVMRAQQLGLDGLYHTPETPAGTCQGEGGSQVLQPFKTHTVPSLREIGRAHA